MNKRTIVLGNGGHASVLIEILLMQNIEIMGFTAPNEEENQFGIPYLGDDSKILSYSPDEVNLVLGIGTITRSPVRRSLFLQFKEKKYTFPNIIHPSSIISPSVQFGEGVQIMAGAIIQTNSHIADNTIVNTGVIIDHDCFISSHIHIAPGTKISGGVSIESDTHVGTGTTIIQGIEIGANCLVGAGSVVVRNISNGAKILGVPAKEV